MSNYWNKRGDICGIEGIEIYLNGSVISFTKLEEEMYGGLKLLIGKNNQLKKSGIGAHFNLNSYQRDLQHIYDEWFESLKEKKFTGEILFKNGEKYKVLLLPRTNFDLGTSKFPSIVYITSKEGKTLLVLRLAKTYSSEEYNGIKNFAKKYYELLCEGKELPTLRYKDILPIPEPNLAATFVISGDLKKLFKEYEKRKNMKVGIIPYFKIVGTGGVQSKNDRVYYVRKFLPRVMDSSLIDDSLIIGYIVTLYGLDLSDWVDRMSEEYCIESFNTSPETFKSSIRNFDLEFPLHIKYFKESGKINEFYNADLPKLIDKIAENQNLDGGRKKNIKRSVREEVKENFFDTNILDYLAKTLNGEEVIGKCYYY